MERTVGSIKIVFCSDAPSTVSEKLHQVIGIIVFLVENAYEKVIEELEMTKATFDDELQQRDAIIDGLLADNTRINAELGILNNKTSVKCKSLSLKLCKTRRNS